MELAGAPGSGKTQVPTNAAGREGLKYDFCQSSRLVSVEILAAVGGRMPFVEEFILRVKIAIRSRRRGRDATTKDA